jgi:hypothetical protein
MKNQNLRFIAQSTIAIFVKLCTFSTVYAGAIFTDGSCLQEETAAIENVNVNPIPPAKNINRAVNAFLHGPPLKGLNVLGYK